MLDHSAGRSDAGPSTDERRPDVSVLSSWFNRSEGIERSLRSVLDQDGVSLEYIIVDDASSDPATRDALDAIADDPRVRIIRNETNIGFTRALCHAASLARGRYIALHDAGDISLPGRLVAQTAFLDAHSDHVLVGTAVDEVVVATGERSRVPMASDHPMAGVDGLVLTHGEVMYRAEAYRAAGGYRPLFYYSQDSDLWRRLRHHGRFGQVDDMLYERQVFKNGIQGNPHRQLMQAVFGNLALVSEEARDAADPDPVEHQHALSLLTQPHGARFRHHASGIVRRLLRERRFGEAQRVMSSVPAGMLEPKMLCVFALLRLLNPARLP